MRGRTSGLAIPHLAVDLPGGGGKITLAAELPASGASGGARTRLRSHRGGRGTSTRSRRTRDVSCPYDAVFYGDERALTGARLLHRRRRRRGAAARRAATRRCRAAIETSTTTTMTFSMCCSRFGMRVPEPVAEQRHREHPRRAADDVVARELAVAHLRDAGDDGHERADERHEARDDDRLPAVLLVEVVRRLQVLGPEQAGARPVEDVRARAARRWCSSSRPRGSPAG